MRVSFMISKMLEDMRKEGHDPKSVQMSLVMYWRLLSEMPEVDKTIHGLNIEIHNGPSCTFMMGQFGWDWSV